MAFSIKQHLLHEGSKAVPFKESPNRGGGLGARFLVMHYTAGTTAAGAINWFTKPEAKASAHLVIDRDGSITQMVKFDRIAWHAGVSQWGEIKGLNGHSIGIELVNAGKLVKRENGTWVNWAGNTIPAPRVTVLSHKNGSTAAGWEIYPAKQIAVALEVAIALHAHYQFEDVLGHDDISPKRKIDPGPAFPMNSFTSKIFGREAA